MTSSTTCEGEDYHMASSMLHVRVRTHMRLHVRVNYHMQLHATCEGED